MERNMTTGRHIVRDIKCKQCDETVGWKYDKAYEAAESKLSHSLKSCPIPGRAFVVSVDNGPG